MKKAGHHTKAEPETYTPATIKIMESRYNYNDAWSWLQQNGKEIYGAHFRLYEEDKAIIYTLLSYFLKDKLTAAQNNINLSKGILLSGPVGCGKTTLMTLMRYVCTESNKLLMKSCREVSFEFIQDGYEVIHRYSKYSFSGTDPRTICFDDLGTEKNLKYYGNECNIMAEILLSRYDLFISKKMITHITTNLSASEIEAAYGNRVRSRLREMFNLVAFDKNTCDKRK